MANNIIGGGNLNFLVYTGELPLRLRGAVQSGELDGTSVFTAARISTIYLAKDNGSYDSFSPTSPFSTLQRLEVNEAYAIQAIQSFEFGDMFPHPDQTFSDLFLDYFNANKPQGANANNIIGGKLNPILYSGALPLRLRGAAQSGELDGTGIFTAARCRFIYATKTTGGFDSFTPGSPFSTLQRLEPKKAYAIQAIQSFEFGDSLPPPSPTFKTAIKTWITANKPSGGGGGGVGARRNLGSNMTDFADGATEIFLKDLFKRTREWIPQRTGQPFGQGGALAVDANGWVTSLESGQSAEAIIYTGDGVSTFPAGQYVIKYDGQGTFGHPVTNYTIVSDAPGRRVIQYNGGDFWINITATNPANYLRNFQVCRIEDEVTLTTEPFNETWLQRMGIFKTVRFMDFLRTNNNPVVTWAERAKLTDYRYSRNVGAPIELAVDICNKLNADGWFCVPARADDNYIQQMATLIFQRLNPNLKIYIEYSNEIWNGIFSQAGHCLSKANEQGIPGSDFDKICRYQGRRSVQIWNAFESAFGGLNRIRRVVGTQHGNAGVTSLVLNWDDPVVGSIKEKTDFIAIAPYFNGLDYPSDIPNPAQLDTLTTAQMLTRMNADIDISRGRWQDERDKFTNSRGTIKTIAYEGGQHLNPNSFPDDASKNKALALYRPLQNSQAMYDAYRRYFDLWFTDMGDDALFMHFSSIYYPTRFGFWGALEHTYQAPADTAKYRAIRDILSVGTSGGSGMVNVSSANPGALTINWSGIAPNTASSTVNVTSPNPGSLQIAWSGITATPSPSPSPTPTPSARSAVPFTTAVRRWSAGNSVTDTVDYEGLNKLAVAAGYTNDGFGRITIPGAPIGWIWDHPNDAIASDNLPGTTGQYGNALTQFTWDYISLQPFDRSVSEDAADIQKFIDLYKTASPNAQLLIYARWPLRSATQSQNTAQSWRDKWNSTAPSTSYPTGQTSKLFFETLANTVRTNNPTLKKPLLIPIGHVMTHLNERLAAGEVAGYSTIWDVYQGADPGSPNDTVHLNDGAGSYLAACTYYSSIYFRSPVGLSRPAEYLTFSDQMRTAIQESVWAVVSSYSYTNGNY